MLSHAGRCQGDHKQRLAVAHVVSEHTAPQGVGEPELKVDPTVCGKTAISAASLNDELVLRACLLAQHPSQRFSLSLRQFHLQSGPLRHRGIVRVVKEPPRQLHICAHHTGPLPRVPPPPEVIGRQCRAAGGSVDQAEGGVGILRAEAQGEPLGGQGGPTAGCLRNAVTLRRRQILARHCRRRGFGGGLASGSGGSGGHGRG
mmetsp:Transcript_108293/g.345851  ORF Transcript_108293/g.345851 Transcript_108293/m.345851 type:complete len:202 (-) Transcript_108293:151-756(-)